MSFNTIQMVANGGRIENDPDHFLIGVCIPRRCVAVYFQDALFKVKLCFKSHRV